MFFWEAKPFGGHVPWLGTVAQLREAESVGKEETVYKVCQM